MTQRTIRFRCPICGCERQAAAGIVGRRVRCADCLNFVEVVPQTLQPVTNSAPNVPPNDPVLEIPIQDSLETLTQKSATQETSTQETPTQETPPTGRGSIDSRLPESSGESASLASAIEATLESQPSGPPKFIVDSTQANARPVSPSSFRMSSSELHQEESRLMANSNDNLSDGPLQPLGDGDDLFPTEAVSGASSSQSSRDATPSPSPDEKPVDRWREEPNDFDTEDTESAGEEVTFGGKGDREAIEMDMTPMVDVTFLLLIFFMVTANFTMMKTKQQPPPSTEEPSLNSVEEVEDDQVVIFIDEEGTYQVLYGDVEGEAPSLQELHVQLRSALSTPVPPQKLLIKAHAECQHDRVISAMDAGTEVGLNNIQVQLTEQDSL